MNSLIPNPSSEQKKLAAWQGCQPVHMLSPAQYRVDAYGHLISWADYGSCSEHGWEVDHIVALAAGGLDSLENVRALHWKKNRQLGAEMGNTPNHLRGLLGLGEIAKHEEQNLFRNALTDRRTTGMFGSRRRP